LSRTIRDRTRPSTVAWIIFGVLLALSTAISIGSFSSNAEQRIGRVYLQAKDAGASHETAVEVVKNEAHADLYALQKSAAFLLLGGSFAVAVLLLSATSKSRMRTWLWSTFLACLVLFILCEGNSEAMQSSPGVSWPAALIVSAIFGGIWGLIIFIRTRSRRRKDKALLTS